MAKKSKITVVSELGTFTRTTARVYTHIVVASGWREDKIRRDELNRVAEDSKYLREYREAQRRAEASADGMYGGKTNTPRPAAQWQEWADSQEAAVQEATARREKRLADNAAVIAAGQFSDLGWCGRLDLAEKLAASHEKFGWANVHIIAVADGKVVR